MSIFEDAAVRAADRAARIWVAAGSGPIAPGTEAHKAAFCRMLLDTHNPYKPSIIDWPLLDPEARDRLVGLPIWDIAVQTEGKARLRVLSYAEMIEDARCCGAPSSSTASRKGGTRRFSPTSSQAYGIPLAPEPEYLPPARPGMGLHGDRLQRMHRQLLRFRPLRAGTALRVFSAGSRRYLRAGHAGGRPAHPILCQLGGVAQT